MTKHDSEATEGGRDRPIEIFITNEMIEAGVYELREKCIGEPLEIIVRDVFIAMMAYLPSDRSS